MGKGLKALTAIGCGLAACKLSQDGDEDGALVCGIIGAAAGISLAKDLVEEAAEEYAEEEARRARLSQEDQQPALQQCDDCKGVFEGSELNNFGVCSTCWDLYH